MIKIATANNLKIEGDVVDRLRALLEVVDTTRWQFTDRVVVEHGALPHSHPVLTLSTRRYENDNQLLADYVHEQLHWFLAGRDEDCASAIAELRKLYPQVPVGHPEGARDEYSTYLHLLLCPIEHFAMVDLIGAEAAEQVRRFWQTDHYCWIYRKVEEDWEQLIEIIERCNLVPIAGGANWESRSEVD